jgi:hydrogenase expression/formation protein HypD
MPDALGEAYRDRGGIGKARGLIQDLAPDRSLKFMHVCGTHEQAVARFGLRTLLPETLEIIPGPGCPVCVTPSHEIEEAIHLTKEGVMVITYGDMMEVPTSEGSLSDAKTDGGEIRLVYGVGDAVQYAREHPEKEVVFFSVGFETTVPSVAHEILKGPPENFTLLASHRLIPPMMELLLGIGDLEIDGWIAPGHVATVIGAEPFELFPKFYRMPTVIAGFEPLDILVALGMLLRQIREEKPRLDNEYARSVRREGNPVAKRAIEEVFEVTRGLWRGVGWVPSSALRLRKEFSRYDARERYGVRVEPKKEILHESCHLVIGGKLRAHECRLFSEGCTPGTPKGPLMVSREGACHIAYRHGALG